MNEAPAVIREVIEAARQLLSQKDRQNALTTITPAEDRLRLALARLDAARTGRDGETP